MPSLRNDLRYLLLTFGMANSDLFHYPLNPFGLQPPTESSSPASPLLNHFISPVPVLITVSLLHL